MLDNLSAVIPWCSSDARFLPHLLRELRKFLDPPQIVCINSPQLYGGGDDDQEILCRCRKQIYRDAKLPDFIVEPELGCGGNYNLARWTGFQHCIPSEWILFLDADEIPRGEALGKWLEFHLAPKAEAPAVSLQFDCAWFRCWWYFRSARYQAETFEECGQLCRSSLVTEESIFDAKERRGIDRVTAPGKLCRLVLGLDGEPLFHHYSWVRTQEEMLAKVRNWGHAGDRNWSQQVLEEFSRPFNGRDFVHGYRFREVEPFVEVKL